MILITGGAGFIGSHCVWELLAEGAKIRVLDDFSSGKRDNLPASPNLDVIEGDVRDAACVDRCMCDVTHVLHLAAQVSVPQSIREPVNSHSINIAGFLNVLDAVRRHGAQRMVYASSAAVYGVPDELPLSEQSGAQPLSPYGLEKLVNEQYANLYGALYRVSTLGLRYFNVYGARQDPRSPYSGVISKFADWAIAGQPFLVHGDGKQTRDFIHAGDVARANVAALKSTTCGVINIGTGRSVTLLELIEAFEGALGGAVEVRHLDAREGEVPYSSVTPRRMREELGIASTTPLDEGIALLMKYLQARR